MRRGLGCCKGQFSFACGRFAGTMMERNKNVCLFFFMGEMDGGRRPFAIFALGWIPDVKIARVLALKSWNAYEWLPLLLLCTVMNADVDWPRCRQSLIYCYYYECWWYLHLPVSVRTLYARFANIGECAVHSAQQVDCLGLEYQIYCCYPSGTYTMCTQCTTYIWS